jgi:UDP-N-acetylmuramoylalanine--D-glutamate ligase
MTPGGRKVLVIGMERTGVATVEFLVAHGAQVTAADTRQLAHLPVAGPVLGRLQVPFRGQNDGGFLNFDWVVISPGVPADLPALNDAREHGVHVIGEVELAAGYLQGPVIGITGSNGKTTTTALTGHILQNCGVPVQVGGNIGTPVTAMIATSLPEQWNVLELSSFQLETTQSLRANVAVLLNITQNHLDRHYTIANYAQAKGNVFAAQKAEDTAVLNADDPLCVEFGKKTPAHKAWFSSTHEVDGLWFDGRKIFVQGKPLIAAEDIPIRGRHNYENVMAATAAALVADAPLEGIAAAIRSFQAVEHRLEFVRKVAGVSYYNDSKATSVDATLKAVGSFAGGLWIILGGKDKGSDYTVLREPLQLRARAALLIGAAAPKIASQIEGAVPLIQAGTLENAIREASRKARPGDVVLLAPACASFDQFPNYEVRGQVFKELVNGLKAE